jgi:hypothetical protein
MTVSYLSLSVFLSFFLTTIPSFPDLCDVSAFPHQCRRSHDINDSLAVPTVTTDGNSRNREISSVHPLLPSSSPFRFSVVSYQKVISAMQYCPIIPTNSIFKLLFSNFALLHLRQTRPLSPSQNVPNFRIRFRVSFPYLHASVVPVTRSYWQQCRFQNFSTRFTSNTFLFRDLLLATRLQYGRDPLFYAT